MNIHNLGTLRTTLFATAAAAACLTIPMTVHAADASKGVDVGEIVVTGSRIRRDTFETPLPLAAVSAEQIRQSGNVILGDVLLDQPMINANSNAQNTSGTLFNSGQARADIRGLGASRTLVLMDGRRIINGDASSPAVDLNMIPSLMVERVEVLPGGQSAVYGSEAIAGVVNLIMKKSYDGLQVDAQYGQSQHGNGDGQEYITGVLWGKKFLDDKLSVLVGGEYARQDPIFQKDRASEGLFPGIRRNSAVGVTDQGILPNSRSPTSPYATFEIRPDAGVSLANPFGTNNPIAATIDVRNPTQVVQLSPACSLRTANPTCQDPALFYSGIYNALQNKTMRGDVRGYAEYQMTDHMKAFVDVSFARVDAYGYFQPAFSSTAGGGTMPVSLKGDNAFLQGSTTADQQLRGFITGAGLPLTAATSINVGKFWQEFGRRDVYTRRHQERGVIGMEGDFNFADRDFHWDWYYQHGRLTGTTESFGVPNIQKVQFATDAVLSGGQTVCRATLPGAGFNAAAAGCVPWDLINGASAAAVAYANAFATTTQTGKQDVGAINLTFDLIKLPAGPLGVAFGIERRDEQSSFVQDPLSASGALFFNAIGTRAGKFSVDEVYAEARIPILKDQFWTKELTLELAGREADYSTIGKASQHRYALEWAPVSDIRFRASQASAVRAPNIVELFSPQGRNFTTAATDPCDAGVFAGATAAQKAARTVTCAAAIQGWNPTTFNSNIGTGRPSLALLQGGNPTLGPEVAKTHGLGVVIQPRWVPALQVSVDYFNYNIAGQIGTIPINTLFQNLCYDDATTPYASNPYCKLIQRDPTGTNGGSVPGGVVQVTLTNQNVAKVKIEGYDYSAAYHFDVADVLKGQDLGRVSLRLDATWQYRFGLQGLPHQAYTQLANTINNATPEWKAQGSVNWTYNKLSVTWTTHYIGSMISNNAFLPTQLDPYMTGTYYEHDLRANYKLREDIDVRAGILNLTDEYPPYLPETFAGTGTGSSNFDNRGRFFFIGVTYRR
jgi:outer membrane receptor protein involved in Fe transport